MNETGFVQKALGAAFALAVFLNPAFAAERPTPEGLNQGPEIFVQVGHKF